MIKMTNKEMKKPYYNNIDYESEIKEFFEEGKKLWSKDPRNMAKKRLKSCSS